MANWKTTLVSLVLGLRKPTSGDVKIFGLDARDRRARSRTGVMLQETGLPQFLRVGEVIDLFRSYYPHPLDRDAVIAISGLTEKSKSMIATLSGGQQQRLYFALAIWHPDVVPRLSRPSGRHEARRNLWSYVLNRGAWPHAALDALSEAG